MHLLAASQWPATLGVVASVLGIVGAILAGARWLRGNLIRGVAEATAELRTAGNGGQSIKDQVARTSDGLARVEQKLDDYRREMETRSERFERRLEVVERGARHAR